MISILIKFFFIIFCSIYTYYKIMNLSLDKHMLFFIVPAMSLLIALPIVLLSKLNIPYTILLLFLLYFTSICIYTQTSFSFGFLISLLSFAISCMALTVVGFLFSVVLTLFLHDISDIQNIIYIFIGGLLQFLLIQRLFKIKRLCKGMPFLSKRKALTSGIVICLTIPALILLLSTINPHSTYIHFFSLLLILLLALALLIWWRRKITQSYVEKLRVSEVEALYKEISDKEHEIEKLHSNNRYLARIIHKDNKLIPAMELAVRNYLQNGMQMKPEDARQYGIDLLAQLQTMAADREGIIQNYHDDYRFRPQIGLYSVDAIIYYMERRAIPHSIRYEYQFDKGLKEVMLSYIDENDAIHLLSDAIENALIATMHSIKKEIKIHIGFIQDILFMDISDTGLPFEPATYQNFGLLQHTTHKDSGGSGVGLLDIWKLKHKYKISLQIYEYPPDDHEYTKKIRFFFDRRNHFLIQSYRSQEITSLITRSDLHVFPYVEGSDFILTLDEEINEEAE